MKIPKETLEAFRKQYKLEFGIAIDEKEAYERFMRLMNVLRIVRKYVNISSRDIDIEN